jgi:hypothetical protein
MQPKNDALYLTPYVCGALLLRFAQGGIMTPSVKSLLGKIPKVGQLINLGISIAEMISTILDKLVKVKAKIVEKFYKVWFN